MSACVHELATLLHLTPPSSSLSPPEPSPLLIAQSQVEYALPSQQLDLDPHLIPVLLLTVLTLLALTLAAATALLLRRLCSLPSLTPAPSPALTTTVASLRHDNEQLQSQLTIAQHALQVATKKTKQDEQKHEEERKRWRSDKREDDDKKKDMDRRLGALKKELDITTADNKRLKDERSRDKEEAEARRKEEVKRREKLKKDEKEERERREKDDKRRDDEKSALQRQLDEKVKELKQEQHKAVELQQRVQHAVAQTKAAAQSTPAKSSKRDDEHKKWEEMTVVMAQLQQQNSSLQQQMEHEQQRLQQQQQLNTQQHDQHEAEEAEKEANRRNRSAEKAGAIQQLRTQLQAAEEQLRKTTEDRERERKEWEGKVEEKVAEGARWHERAKELEMECAHEEERVEELQRQVDEKEAEQSRLESERITEQENRVADLIAQVGVKGLEVAEAKQWQDSVKREMVEEFKGREDDVARAELRQLLGWPAASSTRRSVTRPAPLTSFSSATSSAPSSPAIRPSHPSSSVPSSPSHTSLRAALADNDEQLRRVKLSQAESPKHAVSRKQKQRMQRQQRDDVMQLLKRKQQLEQQLQAEERRETLPPVPLFDAAVQKEEREEQVVAATAVVNQLIAQKTALEEQITSLHQSTVRLSVHQAALESLNAAQSQLATVQQQLEAVQQQQSFSGEVEEAAHLTLVNQLRTELQERNKAAGELDELKTRHQQLVQHHEAQAQQLHLSVHDLTASLQASNELTTRLDSLTDELTQTSSKLASTEEKLQALEQSTVPLEEHTSAVDKLNSQVASLDQQLTEQRTAVTNLTTQLHDIEAALESSDHQLSSTEAAADTERTALLTRVKQLQAEVAQIQDELRTALKRLAATVSFATHQETADALAATQSELHTLRQQLADSSSSHHDSLRSLASQTAALITQLRADVTAQQQQSAELIAERDTLLRALQVRSEELDTLVKEKADLFFLKQQLGDRILSLHTQLAAHTDNIQQLQAAQQQAADEKDALGDELYRALQHYQRLEADKQTVDDELLTLRTSSQSAVQAAEDEVDRLRAELEDEKHKQAEKESQFTKLRAQYDNTKQALADMEKAVSGYMEDVRLKDKEVRHMTQQLMEKQEELVTLQQHFVEQKKETSDGQQSGAEAVEDEHDALNESIVMLESAIKHSVAHREQAVDVQPTAGANGVTPLRPRRFMFVDLKAATSTPVAEQPTTPEQHKRQPSNRAALSPRSTASPTSPRSLGATTDSTATATPTATAAAPSAAAATAASSAAALADAQTQVASLQSSIDQLQSELKMKDEALTESQRAAQHAQHTIDRLRRHAQGKRESASFTLSSLHASQLRMEELNQKISAKMQQHYHSRQPSQQSNTTAGDDSKSEVHVRTQSAPSVASMAGVSGEVGRLLAQLSAEQSKVMEQAQALSALRAQQQTEAVYHSTLVERLEDAEADCKKLKHKLNKKQKETDGINQIIQQAGMELAKVVEESNERAAAIDQLAAEGQQWKGRWDELQAKVDCWAESEHKAWHSSGGDKKESKKEYLKRRWHELTYGGHRHCASCERAAAEKERGEDKHEPHSASVHGQRTPIKGRHGRKESASHNKRADQLQVPGAHHHRSLSDDEEHLEEAHIRHHGRSDSQVSVDGELLDQTLSHSRHDSHAALDTTASDIDHCLHTCKHIIDKLQHSAATNTTDTQLHSDLHTLQDQIIHLAAHIKQLLSTQSARPDLSLILPTFEQSVGSPISVRSAGSAGVAQQVAEGERRVQVLEREKQRLQVELRDERRAMETMEAELQALKEENLARRQDDEEVHTRLQQVKQLVHYQHSRKPSSLTSVGSYSSASSGVSSAFAEEQKEVDEWAFDSQEALIKQLTIQSADAQREIEQLQLLRREDEERINLAVQELRNSRERVMHDYADMVLLNKQLSDQHSQIEQLTEALQQKESTIAQLRADIQQMKEQREAESAAANLSLQDESTANPLTLSMVDNGLAMYQQAVEEKEAELKDVKSLVSAQEATVAKLTKENKELRQRLQQASSMSREASNDSSEALVALGELTKEYRAERRLREKLQHESQLQIMTPAASPVHSRQHSAVTSTTASAASSPRNTAALITPNRLSRELTWWQQHRRRSSGTQPLTGGFSTPAAGVRSALAGAFVNESTGAYNTPAKPRSGQHSRQDSVSTTASVVEEKTVNAHGATQ